MALGIVESTTLGIVESTTLGIVESTNEANISAGATNVDLE